ncbi:ArnT family glycosyltransferase [Tamaricihabitans halophyticus]|nr:glycosyltransferase family 39 protein [Tamaricihabitans halophyticus]
MIVDSARDRAEVRQPHWSSRLGLPLLLFGTALLYLWNLGSAGYANGFYAAAAQAGSQDWTAWLFGSLDPENTITVDKPPASLWLMGLSGRVFGFSPLSMLLPQALAGVAAVWLLHAAVRRTSGTAAALIAGAALALTPVAALMFRYNNPDALLVLLLVAAAYCLVRAIEQAGTRWLVLAGTLVGFAFLAKMSQALLVVPALVLTYLLAAPVGLARRIGQLLAAGVALVCSAGWYVLLVELWPAGQRPYIGGSTGDSIVELALGHNGGSRILGGGSGPGAGQSFSGDTGMTRLFGAEFGTEVAWLLPAALIGLAGGLWFTRSASRTDRGRAALVLWGTWLLGGGAVLSFMAGSTHSYYVLVIAPPLAALVGIGGYELWCGRRYLPSRLLLAAVVASTGVTAFVLLARTPDWLPALRWAVLIASVLLASGIALGAHRFRRTSLVIAVATLLTGFAATGAYAVATVATPKAGTLPVSGAASQNSGRAVVRDDPELIAALRATTERWAAATVGVDLGAGMQLTSERAVMPIGGFFGKDPAPTLERFQEYVAAGEIGYFVLDPAGSSTRGSGAGGGQRAQLGEAARISEWVAANFTSDTIGGYTVYDLQPHYS